jgi:hypothetical protein
MKIAERGVLAQRADEAERKFSEVSAFFALFRSPAWFLCFMCDISAHIHSPSLL